MVINGLYNKLLGPGGGTRRLHQNAFSLTECVLGGRNSFDEGVKIVLLLGMVPPISDHFSSCK